MMAGDEAIGALDEILVVPATTTFRELRPRSGAGPRTECRRMRPHFDHLDTVAKGFIGEPITMLSAENCTPRAVHWMSPREPDGDQFPR